MRIMLPFSILGISLSSRSISKNILTRSLSTRLHYKRYFHGQKEIADKKEMETMRWTSRSVVDKRMKKGHVANRSIFVILRNS